MATPSGAARTRLILNIAAYLIKHRQAKLSVLANEFALSRDDVLKILRDEINLISSSDADSLCVYPVVSDDDEDDEDDEEEPRGDPNDPAYAIGSCAAFRAPVRLLEEEAIAIRTLLAAFDSNNRSHMSEAIGELSAKIGAAAGLGEESGNSLLKAPIAQRLEAALVDMEYAVAESLKVEIEYYSGEHRALQLRCVRPYATFTEAGRFYLRGYCELRRGVRSFRIDRIRNYTISEETFEAPKNAKQRPSAVPGWDGTRSRETFVVRFEPGIGEEVARAWDGSQHAPKYLKDGSVELKLPLFSRSWAIGWVLSFGPQAELLAPEGLREQLVRRIHEMLSD